MSQKQLFEASSLQDAVADLRNDLLNPSGPSISTMGTYRFAILVYPPRQEFELRREIHRLRNALEAPPHDWNVHAISLHRLLIDRLSTEAPGLLDRLVATEKRLFSKSPDRSLEYLKDKLAHFVEGPEGIARDVIRWIDRFVDDLPSGTGSSSLERTVIFLARAGALYPFFRSSALLKHIDGRTRQLPVVLLYPGSRQDLTRLRFMDELPADGDYRPRIYGGSFT